MYTYEECIRKVGTSLINNYISKGQVEAGINGPYDDQETEVRNLSHLIIITAIEYLVYGKKEYYPIIKRMTDDLMQKRDSSGIYKMRLKEGKDQCNGVIGHAWLLEGFFYAYKVTKDFKYMIEAKRVISMHDFNTKLGLWGRPLMGNSEEAIDFTLNHQLWYAATLIEINEIIKDDDIQKQCDRFLNRLPKYFHVNSKGRITHMINYRTSMLLQIKYGIKNIIYRFLERCGKKSYAYKERGYHLFDMVALARIYLHFEKCYFFTTRSFHKSVCYLNSQHFLQGLEDKNYNLDVSLKKISLTTLEKSINYYGYPYNVPGFELAYVSTILKQCISNSSVETCLAKQFEYTYDKKMERFGVTAHDKNTINYRVYEYYRYLEVGK